MSHVLNLFERAIRVRTDGVTQCSSGFGRLKWLGLGPNTSPITSSLDSPHASPQRGGYAATGATSVMCSEEATKRRRPL